MQTNAHVIKTVSSKIRIKREDRSRSAKNLRTHREKGETIRR